MRRVFANIAYELPHSLKKQIEYDPEKPASKILFESPSFSMSLHALARGETLSLEASLYDAFILILEGSGHVEIFGLERTIGSGEFIIIPAGNPHSFHSDENFKMLVISALTQDANGKANN